MARTGAILGEASPWSLIAGLAGLLLVWWIARGLDRFLLRPWRLGRALRAQGLKGTSYRLLVGDVKESARLNKEARSRPMPLSHDIIPRVAPLFYDTIKRYGKICITWFGPVPRVLITDPKLVQEVLSNKFGHFEKPRTTRLGKLLAEGLANHKGEKWAKHRRILNPVFQLEKIKRMLPAFSTCSVELITRWESSAGFDGTFELDIWPEFQNLTGDVISRTAFGSSYQEGRKIFELQAEQAERLIQAFQNMFIPGYGYLPTENNRRMREIDREIRARLRDMIEKRERAIKKGEVSTDDLLSVLMESNMRLSCENGTSNLGMTTEDVIDECRLFYFAGMETTSVLLTWTLVVLSMHPDWQDRAREEVLQVFGKNRPDFDGLSRLKIMTMILYEVLRLYPPAIFVTRQTYKQMELGGIKYPEGVNLVLPIIFIHHDPDIWGEDASKFKPERFAEGISKASKDQVAFFPFGWGPRICIGQNFALLEAKMALSMILQHFAFELSQTYTHAPYTVITLHPQHGAQLKLRRL